MLAAHRPVPPLSFLVDTLWYHHGDQSVPQPERVLPDGRFQLVLDLTAGPGVVAGMRSRYIEIDAAAIRTVMGVVFRPGGARSFFDVPAHEFYNQVVTLDLVWGASVAALRDRLMESPTVAERFQVLETALQQRVNTRLSVHPAVGYALGAFHRAPHIQRVLNVTKDAGLSRRRLSQLFREQVGITPKLYCRLRRFQQVIRQIAAGAPVDWSDVALAGGYADQAHLSHEFREFSGLSPSACLVHARPFLNHAAWTDGAPSRSCAHWRARIAARHRASVVTPPCAEIRLGDIYVATPITLAHSDNHHALDFTGVGANRRRRRRRGRKDRHVRRRRSERLGRKRPGFGRRAGRAAGGRRPTIAHVRSLTERLSKSDVIVYVRPDVTATKFSTVRSNSPTRLTFLSSRGGFRYLVVRVQAGNSKQQQISMLGHEMQHAVSIADASSVVDSQSLRKEFERIGKVSSSSVGDDFSFESNIADDVRRRILSELASDSGKPASKVAIATK